MILIFAGRFDHAETVARKLLLSPRDWGYVGDDPHRMYGLAAGTLFIVYPTASDHRAYDRVLDEARARRFEIWFIREGDRP